MVQNVGSDPSFLGYTLVVHTAGDPAGVAEAVRRQIHALDPAMAIFNEQTMEEHVQAAFFLPRLAATLFGTFGFIGLVLASVGLYGVMSYAVSRRTREIGIRMALGAQPGDVLSYVLRSAFSMLIVGLAGGLAGAFALTRVLKSLLFQVSPLDPAGVAVACVLMALVGILAAWIPASRAARVDPMTVLRDEG